MASAEGIGPSRGLKVQVKLEQDTATGIGYGCGLPFLTREVLGSDSSVGSSAPIAVV